MSRPYVAEPLRPAGPLARQRWIDVGKQIEHRVDDLRQLAPAHIAVRLESIPGIDIHHASLRHILNPGVSPVVTRIGDDDRLA